MKLMIVDDSAEMLKSIRSIVANLRDTIFGCGNGAEAIGMYRKENSDRLLRDKKNR